MPLGLKLNEFADSTIWLGRTGKSSSLTKRAGEVIGLHVSDGTVDEDNDKYFERRFNTLISPSSGLRVSACVVGENTRVVTSWSMQGAICKRQDIIGINSNIRSIQHNYLGEY